MNNKKQVMYYMAVIAAFLTTQAPFWVARKATAAAVTNKKRVTKPKATLKTAKVSTGKTVKAAKKRVVAKAAKPYKVTGCSQCVFDENRKMLICQHGEGLTLELPVKAQKLKGSPLNYVAKLPKRKNTLVGLPVPKKGEKLEVKPGASTQGGLVIDETRLSEASIVMPQKLASLKPTIASGKTTK